MEPFLYGGDMIQTVTLEEATWNELPWKFEAGTPNVAGAVGLDAAIQVLEQVGMEAIYRHEVELTAYALQRLQEIPEVELYGPRTTEHRIGVISFNLQGIHPHDVAYVLDQMGVAVRSGHHCAQPLLERLGAGNTVRASFYLYNTREDVDRWIEALQRVRTILGVFP
ncbi:MAG: aminotransferase class V-fold PLP-dependent enzyme [Candidatus Hydrothermae bacterium]|nr:aminotransferase class V-fold PLP-dependent enzyme [Candidatus Hydrothermae bacterium]